MRTLTVTAVAAAAAAALAGCGNLSVGRHHGDDHHSRSKRHITLQTRDGSIFVSPA